MSTLEEKLNTLYDTAAATFGLEKIAQLIPVFGGTTLRFDSMPADRYGDFVALLEKMLNPQSIARAQHDLDAMSQINGRGIATGARRERPASAHNAHGFEKGPDQTAPEPVPMASLDTKAIWASWNKTA